MSTAAPGSLSAAQRSSITSSTGKPLGVTWHSLEATDSDCNVVAPNLCTWASRGLGNIAPFGTELLR